MHPGDKQADAQVARRREAMALCAQAWPEELAAALQHVGYRGSIEDLRRPEVGLVMVRGRIGGGGAPFNLGEATVTRAAVRLAGGEVGFAYQLGRDVEKARAAATIDALLQSSVYGAAIETALEPVRLRQDREQARRARETAATRVNFFTMARGED